ncbi:uncharacterized protein LOC109609952 [Camponotus floridanus]|uniref:uncharacterized protein LOC109609952 n=1 Tax=Camponotus floridanus TaxID=104421 RepID=UPI000DC68056|nr:uncharacterized protein LOC109609952 [Camponotus floridanus]
MIHGNWICEFVMRHSAKISEFSDSACKRKDKFLTSMNAPQFSRSVAKEKDLKSNTPNIIPLQCADLQIYNARIQEKERFTKRAEIVDHLSESKCFQTAAEEVINNKEEVVTVVRKYGFHSLKDREALDKRINILKKKRKYFELKHKIEETVELTLYLRCGSPVSTFSMPLQGAKSK